MFLTPSRLNFVDYSLQENIKVFNRFITKSNPSKFYRKFQRNKVELKMFKKNKSVKNLLEMFDKFAKKLNT